MQALLPSARCASRAGSDQRHAAIPAEGAQQPGDGAAQHRHVCRAILRGVQEGTPAAVRYCVKDKGGGMPGSPQPHLRLCKRLMVYISLAGLQRFPAVLVAVLHIVEEGRVPRPAWVVNFVKASS